VRLAAKTRSAAIVAGGLSLGLAVALGALGWFLPDAGGSLVAPTLTVLAVGAAAATTGCVVGWHRRFRRPAWLFALLAGAVTLLAAMWTLELSPAVSVWAHSGATARAEAALARTTGRQGAAAACSVVASGGIGPLAGPYRQCAFGGPSGGFVVFSASGQPADRGLAFSGEGIVSPPDACIRHLEGGWFEFTPTGADGGCPFGYRFSSSGGRDG
jgi:hypothetical protein